MSKGKVLDKILQEFYTELYKRSTPSVSFKKLLREAEWINKEGLKPDESELSDEKKLIENGYKKDIHYQNYVIKETTRDSVIREVLSKHKNLNDNDVKILMDNLSKGCGPLTDKEAEELKNKEEIDD